jgi:hypothetical protein
MDIIHKSYEKLQRIVNSYKKPKKEINKYDQLCELLSTNIAECKSPEKIINIENKAKQYSKSCSKPRISIIISPMKRSDYSDNTLNSEVSNIDISGLSDNSKNENYIKSPFEEIKYIDNIPHRSSVDNYDEFNMIMLMAMDSYKSNIKNYDLDVSNHSHVDNSDNSAITHQSYITKSSNEEIIDN